MAKTLSIVFAGDGETTFDSVKALLNDFVGVTGEVEDDGQTYPDWDEDTTIELTYVLTGETTPGWLAAYDWAAYAGLNYDLIMGPDAAPGLYGPADEAQSVKGVDNVAEAVVTKLQRAKAQGKQPYLFVLWGDEDSENPDLEDILAAVLDVELPALDLTAGLDEISFRDTPDAAVEETQADSTEPGRVEDVQPRPATEELVESEEELTEDPIRFEEAVQVDFPTTSNVLGEAQTVERVEVPDEAQNIVHTTYPKGVKESRPLPTFVSTSIELSNVRHAIEALPDSRAKSIALTHFDTAVLWANEAKRQSVENANNELDARLGEPLTAAELAPPATEQKRGRGRPRTKPLPDPDAPKRGRGRPRKVQEDE